MHVVCGLAFGKFIVFVMRFGFGALGKYRGAYHGMLMLIRSFISSFSHIWSSNHLTSHIVLRPA